LPDSQAGYSCNFELRTFLSSNNKHDNSTNQRQATENRRNGNVLALFRGGVDGTEIKNIYLMGVTKSLIGEDQPAENSE
jgi:hypothetical protein